MRNDVGWRSGGEPAVSIKKFRRFRKFKGSMGEDV